MVIRVSALIACLSIGILFFSIPDTTAGGPPVPPAPVYQCAPPVCAAPPCGPRPIGGLCSGVLGICSRVCGTVLGCPAALASAILDPPPPVFPRRRAFCAPPACVPAPVCAPPVYMPPPARPITKVKPRAAVAPPPVACVSAPVPLRMAVPCRPRRPILGCAGLCAAILDMPLRLCSGLLSVSDGPLGPVAGAFETTMIGYEELW